MREMWRPLAILVLGVALFGLLRQVGSGGAAASAVLQQNCHGHPHGGGDERGGELCHGSPRQTATRESRTPVCGLRLPALVGKDHGGRKGEHRCCGHCQTVSASVMILPGGGDGRGGEVRVGVGEAQPAPDLGEALPPLPVCLDRTRRGPPTRAGPIPQLSHIRTVVLLT